MSAQQSQVTPPQVFGQRVREIREQRGLTQGQLAKLLHIDRTTLNKIEKGSRSDVSISQVFSFAVALQTAPVYLITPKDGDELVELTAGGPVLPATDARSWVKGTPLPGSDTIEFMLDLPRDELRAMLKDRLDAQPDRIAVALSDAYANLDEWVDEFSASLKERRDASKKRKPIAKESGNA